MKSLHTRLDPIKDEVLEVTRAFGRFKAMCQFKVASYDRFSHWLKEVTGDENYGINPKIKSEVRQSLGDQLVESFLRKVADLETKVAQRDKRIAFLEWQISNPAIKEQNQALAVLQACEV